jgi:glycosyltransferase involved in cell wall biosynthesis
VRIGIDMLGVQSAASRGRGIGRYGRSFARALVERPADHEFVLYAHDGLPTDAFPDDPRCTVRPLPAGIPAPEAMERVAAENPDHIDRLLILSPFELHHHYRSPARPADGTPVAAIVYDLLPFLEQERYLAWPQAGRWFYRSLERLRGYDCLLAISEATAAETRRLLGRSERKVVAIGTASDPSYFVPDRTLPLGHGSRETFRSLGIDRPYVFTVASTDERKNLAGLLDAFALLRPALRERYQLVVTCALDEAEAHKVRAWAFERGLVPNLVLTGGVPDATLRLLYQRCAAFAFPSRYEGFGLPILEAMHCGAAIVAGNNSSQPEVLGDAGLLADADEPEDFSTKLASLLADGELAEGLRVRALIRAREFRWSDVADRALRAIEELRPSRLAVPRRGGKSKGLRPRVAKFAPWPPKESGVADYALRLGQALRELYDVDLYHDPASEPILGARAREFRAIRPVHFARNDAVLRYRGVLHHMGNSHHHQFVYDAMGRTPGIVTLHDFHLTSFQCWRACRTDDPVGFIRRELASCERSRADEVLPTIHDPREVARSLDRELVRRDLPMNRRVIEAAEALVVHSSWAWRRIRERYPEAEAKTFVIPLGADPARPDPRCRWAVRERFGLPADALVFASFGILHAQKMNLEALRAFAPVAREFPDAMLVFVGPDHTEGAARREAESLGLAGRVRFLGWRPDDEFLELIAASDVGISLRRPPTFGETSGALLHLLRHGIPTVVIDADAFADFPDDVVVKLRWDGDVIGALERTLHELAAQPARRAALRDRAWQHIERQHRWGRIAALYAEVIERMARRRAGEAA